MRTGGRRRATTRIDGLARLGVALAVATAVATACTTSRQRTAQPGVLAGRVEGPDGAAAPGRPVAVTQEGGFGDLFAVPLILGTAGLVCLADDFCPRGSLAARDSDRTGSFAFDLRRTGPKDVLGFATVVSVSSALAPSDKELSGPASSARLRVQVPRVDVVLRSWAPPMTVSADGAMVSVIWPDLASGGLPSATGYGVTFDAGPSSPAWVAPVAASPYGMDRRVLEDFEGGVSVTARARGSVPGSPVEYTFRSARVPYTSRVGAPASRGRPCRVPVADGRPELRSPCPLTDGDLTARIEGDIAPGPIDIDLGGVAPVSLVVVRGCVSSTCAVEVSVNGKVWAPLSATDGPTAALTAEPPMPARFVRVAGGSTADLVEVSVWTGPGPSVAGTGLLIGAGPAGAGPARSGAARFVAVRAGEGPGGQQGLRLAPVAASVAMLVSVIAALVASARGRWRPWADRGGRLP